MATRLLSKKDVKRTIKEEKRERKYLKKLNKLIFEAEYGLRPLAYGSIIQRKKPYNIKAAYKILIDVRSLLYEVMEYFKKAFEEEEKLANRPYHGIISDHLKRIYRQVALAFRICERLLLAKSHLPDRDINTIHRMLLISSRDAEIALDLEKKRIESEKQQLERAAA